MVAIKCACTPRPHPMSLICMIFLSVGGLTPFFIFPYQRSADSIWWNFINWQAYSVCRQRY